MSSPSPVLCPMCLRVAPSAVSLPCGHSFCLQCLRTMDEGLDRHCCPQCHQEYQPHYDADCNCSGHRLATDDQGFQNSTSFFSDFGADCPQNKSATPTQANNEQREFKMGQQNNSDKMLTQYCIMCQETRDFRSKASELKGSGVNNQIFQAEVGLGPETYLENAEAQSEILKLSENSRKSEQRRHDSEEIRHKIIAKKHDVNEVLLNSELFDYLQSKIVKTHLNFALKNTGNKEEDVALELETSHDFQDTTLNLEVDEKPNHLERNNTLVCKGIEVVDTVSHERSTIPDKTPISEEDAKRMAESKLKLKSEISGLSLELDNAETRLKNEQRFQLKLTTTNGELREKAQKLMEDVASLAQKFSAQVVTLMDQELDPGERIVCDRVRCASERAELIKKVMQEAEHLLEEENTVIFTSKVDRVVAEARKCKDEQQQEETPEVESNLAKLCPEVERLHCKLRTGLGLVQRSLRSLFNPSEVTFDPETLHPNLVLSEDMKTVTFSSKKREYEPSSKRFSSFFQVLSAQSFTAGVHRWEVELEGAPWMLGVCSASALPRSGLNSALESCPLSWVLMWNSNQLTALERGRAVPLKKTSEVSRTLRIHLDREEQRLRFYHLSLSGGSSLVHTSTVDTEEPLQLALRILSGDPRGRVTVRS